MHIPKKHLDKFVREIADECLVSQTERINRGIVFQNYVLYGSENSNDAALYNKTWTYIDDLQSLLYSPINLRFHIGDQDLPNVVETAKCQSAAAKLRGYARKSDIDTKVSEAVWWSLVKGKAFIKTTYKRKAFAGHLIQPEAIGVLRENHTKLDEDMEAFVHSMLITPYQFERLISGHPPAEKDKLRKLARNYIRSEKTGIGSADSAQKQVVVGGLYPFQAAGSATPNNTRGIVDWMANGSPLLSPNVAATLLQLDEVWIWDDNRADWATFQIIGNNILIFGKYVICNALAWNAQTGSEVPELHGHHPFTEFAPNQIDNYFWGRSEIVNVALLQEAINSRMNGINGMLRKQEDPPQHFTGGSGVNQNALAKFRKPGGYFVDQRADAKITPVAPQISQDLWASLHEYERMFDDMGGLPPIAKGRGEAGVRSQGHAETLVRMFSPRFKDRAILVERDVEGLGGLMLEMARAHEDKKLVAWVPKQQAGIESPVIDDPLIIPPAPGLVPVRFAFADLDDDVHLTVNAHSSSPAFSAEEKALTFDLFKIGAESAEDVVRNVDVQNEEELVAGIERRAAAKAAAQEQEAAMKALAHGGGHKK